jgi:hypothetical protein
MKDQDAIDPPTKHQHVPTGTTCLKCHGVAGEDDKGACHGHGFFCDHCGFYRLQRRQATRPKGTPDDL